MPPLAPTMAAPAPSVEPVLPPAAAAQPATPVFTAPVPVVQAVASVDERREAAIAASQVEPASRAEQPAARAVAPVQRKAIKAEVAPVAAVAPAQIAPSAPVAPTPVQLALPIQATPVETEATPAPANTSTNPALLWALGGGVLLLAGVGGTALMRRRRTAGNAVVAETRMDYVPVSPAVETTPKVAAPIAPIATRGSAMPVAAARIEDMVAAPPSPENPFLTHAKRTRRAKFLLARQGGASVDLPARAAVMPNVVQPVDRSQTIYSFGKGSARSGGTFLKPRTS